MRRVMIGVVLAGVLAASCGTAEEPTRAESKATSAPTTTQVPATTRAPKPTQTTVSERLQHWRDVVKPMRCPELADLEAKRMEIAFNDQTESLIAIHERQAELHC